MKSQPNRDSSNRAQLTRKVRLKEEIMENLRHIKWRSRVVLKLLKMYFVGDTIRSQLTSVPEYETYWEHFWEHKEICRTDLPFVNYDKPILGLSPLEYRRLSVIPTICEKIRKYQIASVLEIGSGAGLNLLLLAQLFPDVSFTGLEPTGSGVRVSKELLLRPPPEFWQTDAMGEIKNVEVLRGSVLGDGIPESIRSKSFDLVFTSAVLEQLHNDLDEAFLCILALNAKYFLFFEEWLEANYVPSNYHTLVEADYFRVSWNYLHRFPFLTTIDRQIPALQPSWLKYAMVFCEKTGAK